MKMSLIAVFVSVLVSTLPVKAELFRLGTYGNCKIYEEINEFNDELEGYHFTCGHNQVLMSLGCKKERNSQKWFLIFNGSSHIGTINRRERVEIKIRIGKQPAMEFTEGQVYTATSFGWKKLRTASFITEGLRSIKPSDKRLIFRAGKGNTEIIPLTGKEKDGIDPWLAKCETLVKK